MAMERSVTDLGNEQASFIKRDLQQELAAISIKILDKEGERTQFNKDINSEIKELKMTQRDLANQIKAGGVQTSLIDDGEGEN